MKFLKHHRALKIVANTKTWTFYDNFPIIDTEEFYYLVYRRMRNDSEFMNVLAPSINLYHKNLKEFSRFVTYFDPASCSLFRNKIVNVHYPSLQKSDANYRTLCFYDDRTVLSSACEEETFWNFGYSFLTLMNKLFISLRLTHFFKGNHQEINKLVNDELTLLFSYNQPDIKSNRLAIAIKNSIESCYSKFQDIGINDFSTKGLIFALEREIFEEAYPLKISRKHFKPEVSNDLCFYAAKEVFKIICKHIRNLLVKFRPQEVFFEHQLAPFSTALESLCKSEILDDFRGDFYKIEPLRTELLRLHSIKEFCGGILKFN